MNVNNHLMKTIHKSPGLKKRPNIETIYQNNNYLIQIMKQTEKMTYEKPFKKKAVDLKNILHRVHTENNFYKNPLINTLKNENENFETEYKEIAKRKSKTSTKYILNDLINAYKKRNYKIPKFSPENNIFKINPLIEENTQKMSLFFYKKGQTINVEEEKISNKIVLFLNKLSRIIKNINAAKKTGISKSKSEKPPLFKKYINKNIKKKKSDNIGKLTEDIETIKKLLNTTEFSNYNSQSQNSYSLQNLNFSRNSRINKKFSNFSVTRKKSNTINIQSPKNKKLKARISFKENILTSAKNKNFKKESIASESSPNNFLLNHCNSNKSQKNPYFDIFNTSTGNKSEKKENGRNFHRKTKIIKNDHKKLPIFIRTQATKKTDNDNGFFLSDKKSDFKLKTRNLKLISSIYSNRTDFVNYAYKKAIKGKYDHNEMENCIKKYLIESKELNEEESLATINKIKNTKSCMGDVEKKVRESDLNRKLEKLYLNSFMIKRIEPKLLTMKRKEDMIFRLQNIFSSIGK